MRSLRRRIACAVLGAFLLPAPIGGGASAENVSVAVASNFVETLEAIAASFAEAGRGRLVLSPGSTGHLYAKIRSGAPYDVFLAADAERPRLLAEEGVGVDGTQFTYALGRLVLWSADPSLVDGPELLGRDVWRHLAIASPELAPYGAAAQQTLRALGLWEAVTPRLVRGTNIGQAFQFVATGNAEIGLVALAQVQSARNTVGGSGWRVPAELHEPIRQGAILLVRGADNAVARRFLEFLRGEAAGQIIESHGYGRGE